MGTMQTWFSHYREQQPLIPIYLPAQWSVLMERTAAKHLFLILEYSVVSPSQYRCHLHAESCGRIIHIVRRLSEHPRCKICVVGNESVEEIRARTKLPLIYCGNHGFEISGPGFEYRREVTPERREMLAALFRELKRRLALLTDIRCEFREISVGIYYDNILRGDFILLKRILFELIRPLCQSGHVMLRRGNRVMEIIPVTGWNRNNAMNYVMSREMRRYPAGVCLPVFVGDSNLAEESFRMINRSGISILVGKRRRTYARYYLRNNEELAVWMERLDKPLGTKPSLPANLKGLSVMEKVNALKCA